MPGLQSSRWAPRDSRPSSVPALHRHPREEDSLGQSRIIAVHTSYATHGADSSAVDLERYSRIVRRMKWKLPFLNMAYREATLGSGDHSGSNEAELMFKLDFFEYYMLCERALVHLQGVFGITISRGAADGTKGPARNIQRNAPPTHRFHANVLEALDRVENPLHNILGTGDVRHQLAKAKDLRNRWKNADGGDTVAVSGRQEKVSLAPLAAYDLAAILGSIHEGLDRAFLFTKNFVEGEADILDSSLTAPPIRDYPPMDMDKGAKEEGEWDFMIEAMDWEAV